ncbi:hypothetical protein Rcae01_00900 [Novipirellula caenicola]|uniref:Uncharacterized protein n=1 Tax=Novipirellula caenicola TaxID=1536901 RepID=A0ABP9VJS5_9BACT
MPHPPNESRPSSIGFRCRVGLTGLNCSHRRQTVDAMIDALASGIAGGIFRRAIAAPMVSGRRVRSALLPLPFRPGLPDVRRHDRLENDYAR